MLDLAEFGKVPGRDKGDRLAALTCPAGPADPVDIIFNVLRDIEVDHHINILHVNPAGCNIRSNQDIDLPLTKPAHHPVTL